MSKHTPGRWHWWTSCSWKRLRSEDGMKTHDVVVPYVARSDGHPDLMVSDADMRLIAAAPEMLEAHERDVVELGFLLRAIEEGGHTDELRLRISDILRRKAAVFAKARGE